jgi:PAS domain-containing protein
MKKTHSGDHIVPIVGSDFFDRLWEESWTYIKTVVDVVREPILILDRHLCVMAANEAFYTMFQVEPGVTERTKIYELGNGQWDIPALRTLLEDILPHNTFFKGFEVAHTFPTIGRKIMILNARQIHKSGEPSASFPPIIMLAMEDVTEMINVAETLARHTNQFEVKMGEKTQRLEADIHRLEVEMQKIRKIAKEKK